MALRARQEPPKGLQVGAPLTVGRDDGLLQLSPAALQQMLAAAVASATSSPSHEQGPKLPKFWEEEPEAWTQKESLGIGSLQVWPWC